MAVKNDGAVYIVCTQPGEGGQAKFINFINIQGEGGSKKAKKLAYVLVHGPIRNFFFNDSSGGTAT